ncbi:beta-glucosidase [Parvularcula dongshanensis]|uniref:Beta-glucosidase n=1 Tax=Parvularcula dongshanensis TaxID=1173995 RepID=A0A840I855_9PROT|nr:glycoside hydrolase family 3 C-terminal domain-containing protein [Parvularcula dongshanensis]MBB4660288.1 beta-glucosidase [Parvularcula dongshanensis]
MLTSFAALTIAAHLHTADPQTGGQAGPQPSVERADQPWMNASSSPDERASALVAEMTQEEKLTLVFGYFGTDFPPDDYEAPEEARQGSAGYVPGIPRLGVPPQWQTDAGVGVATQGGAAKKRERTALPSGIATAATWNPNLAYKAGAMIGSEARSSGFNVMLAGGVNLLREAENGRNFEYGGEDPLLAGTIVGAQIAGIQSNRIISTIKHFAVNDQETDRSGGNSVADDAALRVSDLLAFEFAFEQADPGAVMCAYNQVNGTFSCENEYLLTKVLREDWDYRGYVLSDWGAVHSTVAAANAGLEQESGFPFDDEPYFGEPLKRAVSEGTVPQARLDEMVTRIVRTMIDKGLFDDPVEIEEIDFDAHAAITQAGAAEGAVLLKNEGGILPLSPDAASIAVIGGHADKGVLSGGGSSQVYPVGGNAVPGLEPTSWPGPVVYYPSSPLEEIRRRAPDAEVRFVSGEDVEAAAALAAESDIVLVFATQWATESEDTTLELPNDQDALIAAVAEANDRAVVVLETGGPVLMPWAGDVAGILEAWFPGTEGGAAIADLLFGVVNPSGHLPATFPASREQLPRTQHPQPGDVIYDEGAAVGYKWYDANGLEPLFPFGHGLSYTAFAYDGLEAAAAGQGVSVRFTVTNRGERAGKDVAQVYVAGSGWEAPKRLGAYEKVELEAGDSTQVELSVDPRLLATWNADGGGWITTAGEYRILLGTSSVDIVGTATVELSASTLPASYDPPQ